MTWSSAIYLTDLYWIAASVAMCTFVVLLTRSKLRPSAARWFTMLVCVSVIDIIGVVMNDLINRDFLLGLRAISIGRAFIPFCMLGFTLAFPYRHPILRSRLALFALALPSLITVVATDPCFAPGDVSYQLKYHIPWMSIYFIWAYLNLILSYRRIQLRRTKRQHLILTLATVPTTCMHFITSIVLPAIGLNEIWRYNWIPILGAFFAISIVVMRHGYAYRYQDSLSRSRLDGSIDSAISTSQFVTHAAKNTLQVIRSLAQTATSSSCPDREARMNDIINLCDDLAARMNRLNLLARGRQGLNLVNLDLLDPLTNALARTATQMSGIKIDCSLERPGPLVNADRTHLEEVIVNLLINAAEAMPGGGELRIGLRVENDWVILSFCDRGVGMTQEQLSHIFEPFHSSKKPNSNWGIGLSYCHMVMQRLGGDLLVESAPGSGSTFFLVLPQIQFSRGLLSTVSD